MTEVRNGCENGPVEAEAESSLDSVLVRIGEFGRFQFNSYALIILPMVFNAILMWSYVFLAGSVVHRCRVPECDGPNSVYQELWTNFSIPTDSRGNAENCNRLYNSNYFVGKRWFELSKLDCISNDFDIYCTNEWKLSMVGTMTIAAQLVGTPLGGYFSDRYGRRTLVAFGGFFSAILGIIRSFSSNYYVFQLVGFFENITGDCIHTTLFIIAIELVGPKKRVLSCAILPIFFSLGQVLLAIVAKNVHNWRWILRILYIPALGHIALLWILPESVRWLLSRGEEEKATETLLKAAKVNKRKLSYTTIENLIRENRLKLQEADKNGFPMKQVFQAFSSRILSCSLCWFLNALSYYGQNISSVALLGGNKYHNFMYLALVEIPAHLMLYLTINRFGRRYSLFGYLSICGISLLATIFISKDFFGLQFCMFLIGKMAITIAYQTLYFFTSELFPTNVRSSMFSVFAMSARIGAMAAPQTVLLTKYNTSVPIIISSLCAFVSALLALQLPETMNVALPSTMKEAEKIGHKISSKEVKEES